MGDLDGVLTALLAVPSALGAHELKALVAAGGHVPPAALRHLRDLAIRTLDESLRRPLLAVLLHESHRTGDEDVLAGLPSRLGHQLAECASYTGPLSARTLKTLAEVAGPSAELAMSLESQIAYGADLTSIASWIFAQLEARRSGGRWRADAAYRLIPVLSLALTQANTRRRIRDEDSLPSCIDRDALAGAARDVFHDPLRRMARDRARSPTQRADLRQILVAVAASEARWDEVDALLAASPERDVASLAQGLLFAAENLAPESARDRDAVGGVVARLVQLRSRLDESGQARVEHGLTQLTERFQPGESTVTELVTRLLRCAPGQRFGLARTLRERLESDPALAARLPPVDVVPADGPRTEITDLHWVALLARDDVAGGLELARLGAHPGLAFQELQRGLDRWIDVFAIFVDDASPRHRAHGLHLMTRAAEEGGELAGHASALLRSAVDRDKVNNQTRVAKAGKIALVAALARTTDRGAWVTAARDLLHDLAPVQAKELRVVLRRLLPEAVTRGEVTRAQRPPNEDELLAAIYAAPDDDGPRLVYADALLEAGDARGELIVLQCARARTDGAPTARERTLLRIHGRAWLGDAADLFVPASVIFERGFVAGATLVARDLRARWPHAAPASFRLLERLDLGGAWVEPARVLAPETFPRLWSVGAIDHAVLASLARTDLEDVAVRGVDVTTILPALERQPRLRTVTIEDGELDALVALVGESLPGLERIASGRRTMLRAHGVWTAGRAAADGRS